MLQSSLAKILRASCLVAVAAMLSAPVAFAVGEESNDAYDTGLERLGRKDYDGAIQSFSEVVSMNPRHTKAYLMRGKAFFQMKDYHSAIEDFNRAIEQDATNSEVFLYKGAAESRNDQDAEAVNDYEKAIRLDPRLVKNYDQGKATEKPKVKGSINEHSVDNYEAAMQRVKANP
jgi:tetratricopeptide (TPR) repeat protein